MKRSQLLKQHFQIQLPNDLDDWFDAPETFSLPGWVGNSITVDALLDRRSSVIWGGLMLPDTLPIIGNGCGDELCFRVDRTGKVLEYIWWEHEGGGWEVAGTTLAEAIAYVDVRTLSEENEIPVDATGLSPVAQALIVCRNLLHTPLERECRSIGGLKLAKSVGITWETLHDGFFDTSQFDRKIAESIGTIFDRAPADILRQDWEAAASMAEKVTDQRRDLAWPFAICGWEAERRGDLNRAIHFYENGLFALGSSASFTNDWLTPPYFPHTFVLRRLNELKPLGISEAIRFYIEIAGKRDGVQSYFTKLAQSAEAQGDYTQAYDCYYRSGWDSFSTNDRKLLEALERTSKAAGWPAVSAIARAHADS